MDWVTCINTFRCCVEQGTFTKAADVLFTTPPVVSKRIAWLEDKLGAQLFRRTSRAIYLTDAGKLLCSQSKLFLDQLAEIQETVCATEVEPAGDIRLGTPAGIGQRTLTAMMTGFLAKYPKVNLHQKFVSPNMNFYEENIDILITHLGKPVLTEGLYIEKIMEYNLALYCAPSYIEQYGEPTTPKELAQHNCIYATVREKPNVWELNGKKIHVKGNYTSSHVDAVVYAAAQGLGIVYVTRGLIYHQLQAGELVPIMQDYQSKPITAYLCYPDTDYLSAKYKALLEHVRRTYHEYVNVYMIGEE